MTDKRPLPRLTLAKNLKLLLERTGMTSPEVAKRAGVDRKTLNNQLNGRYDPRPEQVQLVAEVFGYNSWDLLNPRFSPDDGRLNKLLVLYSDADEAGRASILQVAEIAARYREAE